MKYINGKKRVEVITRYTYRDFYHELYVYDHDRTWEYVGYSKSRYYYKYWAMLYFNDRTGEHECATGAFSHQRGYGPEYVAAAPNHKKYSKLGDIAVEFWKKGRFYRETH